MVGSLAAIFQNPPEYFKGCLFYVTLQSSKCLILCLHDSSTFKVFNSEWSGSSVPFTCVLHLSCKKNYDGM